MPPPSPQMAQLDLQASPASLCDASPFWLCCATMSRIPNYIEISSNFVWNSLHSSKYIQIQHDPSIFKYNIIQPSQGIFRSSFYHLSLSKFFCQSNVLFYPSTTGTHLLPRLVDSTHCPCALARIFAARWWGVKWWPGTTLRVWLFIWLLKMHLRVNFDGLSHPNGI